MQTPPVHLSLLRHLLRPARGGAAAVVIVFALLLSMAAKASFVGIPLALLLASWFFKYAYILFDHTVRGFDEPPTLDIQMMNPIDEQRPLGASGDFRTDWLRREPDLQIISAPPPLSVIAGRLSYCFCPPRSRFSDLESNILKAAYPVDWFSLVRGWGSCMARCCWSSWPTRLGLKLLWHLRAVAAASKSPSACLPCSRCSAFWAARSMSGATSWESKPGSVPGAHRGRSARAGTSVKDDRARATRPTA